MNELIAKRYVKALLIGVDNSQINALLDSLKQVNALFSSEKFKEIIASPFVNKSEKLELVLSAVKNEKVANLVKLLATNSRLDLIPTITELLISELNRVTNSYNGVIYTDSKLSAREVSDLEKKFGAKLNIKLQLTQEICEENSLKVDIDALGVEISLSTPRLKSQLQESILKAI
jgi:F-type H+-transporting ATPase subunit delta